MSEIKIGRKTMGVCATNCYFLYREGGTKAVVVDPAENGAGIFKLLSEKDFTVEAILLTHGHFDHIGGAAELKKHPCKGVCIGRREESLPDAGVKPVCPDAPCCDDRSG